MIQSRKPVYAERLGRPPITENRARTAGVYLDEDSIAFVRQLGEGNFNAGIRKAIEIARRDALLS